MVERPSPPATINAELAEPAEQQVLFCEFCGFCVECRAVWRAGYSDTLLVTVAA